MRVYGYRLRQIFVISLFFIFLLSVLCKANIDKARGAETYNVGGNNYENYSSLQDAINKASNNDTIYVYSGTYLENIFINK